MSKKKLSIAVISIFILLLFCSLLYVSNYMMEVAIRRESGSNDSIHKTLKVSDDPEQQEREEKARLLQERLIAEGVEWGKSACTETYLLQSEDKLLMSGYFFTQPDSDNHLWAVILHGYNDIASEFWNYAKTYYERGWNVLTPDLRASGKTEGTYIGMGWLDRRDIILWLKEIIRRDPEAKIIIHGFSMGASAVMMASGESDFPPEVKVCIEDAGYSSVWTELEDKLNKIYHLPSFPILNCVSLFAKFKAGYSIKEADCVPQLQKNKTPMLFIHGDADDYNPFYMLDVVYNANACEQKEKLVVHGARHVMSSFTEPDLYWSTVWSFIGRYVD
ncbi:MAG: alpha/beta hydrolase [Treponema sp.]|nr:alpha/beta hydrolase [Treponema sp.]